MAKLSELILVLNTGSSSLKFAILHPDTETVWLKGYAECFHLPEACIGWQDHAGCKKSAPLRPNSAHQEALAYIAEVILPQFPELQKQLTAIGHRIVHGGEHFQSAVRLTTETIQAIHSVQNLAPLHNPAGLLGITTSMQLFPRLRDRQVAVFDTAFHQTMPEHAFLYALPYEFYTKHKIRRYGFHGTSHAYVIKEAAHLVGIKETEFNAISCHLGNGVSVTAVQNGCSIDTSMGLTPLEGVPMGTRSGDLDPAIVFFLQQHVGMTIEAVEELLSKRSGLKGITGVTSDFRYVEREYQKNQAAKRALEIFCYRLSKMIASYAAALPHRLDALIFTGAIGENSTLVRSRVVDRLNLLGFDCDPEKNMAMTGGRRGCIESKGSRYIVVLPTNEELMIAQQTQVCLASAS